MKTTEKLKALRDAMSQKGIDIYIIVNSDPHESEYLPDHWKCVRWLTGFRGEVATVIITANEALLWTDSRFFISGEQQLDGTGIKLMKMKIDMPTTSWLNSKTDCSDKKLTIAADRKTVFGPILDYINTDIDLISNLWTDRPEMPNDKIEVYPLEYDGEPASSKIENVLSKINANHIKKDASILLHELDQIAWLLNLRGNDIHCTPVFYSYLLLNNSMRILFVDPNKLTPDVRKHLNDMNVECRLYEEGQDLFKKVHGCKGVVTHEDLNFLHKYEATCLLEMPANPIPLMRGIKNDIEIEGYRRAMLRDGIAMTQFYHWLEKELPSGEVTELMCVDKLKEFRQQQPLYRDESFDAIVAWNEHGALPHYEPTAESDVRIIGDGLLLIDTGGHYMDGTTDITRTIGVGNVSEAMKRDYTLVLKGHIRLATAVFPEGTRGDQLDALARIDLWRDGKTYRHGTSHGVGHYLGVHEGPESVRMEHNPQPLIPGMLFSNEPAIYLGGKYGIRHENCVLVRSFDVDSEAKDATPCNQEEQGQFLCLETLTLCYIDTTCIDMSIMTQEEIEWVNNYNSNVLTTLRTYLTPDLAEWLAAKCQKIA